jgi:hypothetical protein
MKGAQAQKRPRTMEPLDEVVDHYAVELGLNVQRC